jgi:sugar lactone lactonase YvrE
LVPDAGSRAVPYNGSIERNQRPIDDSVTAPVLSAVDPLRVIEGARLWLRGSGLPVPTTHQEICTINGHAARAVFAARDRIAVEVPAGLDGGRTEVRVPWLPGATLFVDVGVPIATGLHQVDNPAIDSEGRVYVTYSGSRGQQAPVSVFRVAAGGPREPFVSGIVNVTSMIFGPDGRLYLSSRFDGSIYRVFDDGKHEVVASDLGLACGLAFAPDGTLLVGDRSGTIFHIDTNGRTQTLATLPASVAAFHLAMGPDGWLYVTGPTLASYDRVYRVAMDGGVETIEQAFGRPQGLAFDRDGNLHVVEALAGGSGIYRLHGSGKTLVVAGPRLVGLAFGATGALVVATSDTVYSFM